MDGSADTAAADEEYEEEMVVLSVEFLDLILVPIGLIIMLGYHLFLLYRYLNHPHTTVMGFENHDRRAWVQALMQVWNLPEPVDKSPWKNFLILTNWIIFSMNRMMRGRILESTSP